MSCILASRRVSGHFEQPVQNSNPAVVDLHDLPEHEAFFASEDTMSVAQDLIGAAATKLMTCKILATHVACFTADSTDLDLQVGKGKGDTRAGRQGHRLAFGVWSLRLRKTLFLTLNT